MDSTPTKQVETILTVRVTHSQPLPFDVHQKLAEVAAHRVYDWLYARGVECGAKAEISSVTAKTSDCLAERYRAIVQHYAKLAKDPATVEHARHMVREFRAAGLDTLAEDVAREINANNNPPLASNGEHVLQDGGRPNEN